jgi:hypothetical protein
MSAVLAAIYDNHEAAEEVRVRLVNDGFPTDRVELTSRQELGQAKLVPTADVGEKLTQYFRQLFPDAGYAVLVRQLPSEIQAGHAVIAVQPRGQVETERAVQILNEGQPLQMQAADLDNQLMEHAAAHRESSALSWVGRVMVAPQAPDR